MHSTAAIHLLESGSYSWTHVAELPMLALLIFKTNYSK